MTLYYILPPVQPRFDLRLLLSPCSHLIFPFFVLSLRVLIPYISYIHSSRCKWFLCPVGASKSFLSLIVFGQLFHDSVVQLPQCTRMGATALTIGSVFVALRVFFHHVLDSSIFWGVILVFFLKHCFSYLYWTWSLSDLVTFKILHSFLSPV